MHLSSWRSTGSERVNRQIVKSPLASLGLVLGLDTNVKSLSQSGGMTAESRYLILWAIGRVMQG